MLNPNTDMSIDSKDRHTASADIMAYLICQDLRSSPYHATSSKNLPAAFDAKAADPPSTLVTLFATLLLLNFFDLRDLYNNLAKSTYQKSQDTLLVFDKDGDEHCFLVCASFSEQNQDPWIHCLAILVIYQEEAHPLIN